MRLIFPIAVVALLLIGEMKQGYAKPAQPPMTYSQGNGLAGTTYEFNADGSFTYSSFACMGGGEGQGHYRIVGDRWVLTGTGSWTSRIGNRRETTSSPLREELFPVQWGQRLYLLSVDDMERFAHDINAGLEPRTDFMQNYLIRSGDERRPAFELPLVPEKFRSIFTSPPLVGVVQRVNRDWQVTIPLGRREGVRKGMLFTDFSSKYSPNYEVKYVDAHWALLESGWTEMVRELRNAKKGDLLPPTPEMAGVKMPGVGLRLRTHNPEPEVRIIH